MARETENASLRPPPFVAPPFAPPIHRYSLDVNLDKTVITKACLKEGQKDAKFTAKKEVKNKFSERYMTGNNPWFFQKLRF